MLPSEAGWWGPSQPALRVAVPLGEWDIEGVGAPETRGPSAEALGALKSRRRLMSRSGHGPYCGGPKAPGRYCSGGPQSTSVLNNFTMKT